MRKKKQVTVCLTVCLVLFFVSIGYAAPIEIRGAPVNVINTNSKPIPVTDVKKYPIQQQAVVKFPIYSWIKNVVLYTVPLNKRLIIEYFSCKSNSGSYSTSYSCFISSGTYPNNVDHWLPTTLYSHPAILGGGSDIDQPENPKAFMSAGQTVQVYAEPGTDLLAGAFRQNQAIMNVLDYPEEYMSFSFSGYLVDIAP
jgi:hypothetical protein